MKHHAHAQSYSTYNAIATAKRAEDIFAGIIFSTLFILIIFGLVLGFAYQTDPRPVDGTGSCKQAREHFDNGPIITWSSRSKTDTYDQYVEDRRMAQCKAPTLAKYLGLL